MQPRTIYLTQVGLSAYNTETFWLFTFAFLFALGLLSVTCLCWYYMNQARDYAAARTEVERENAWLTRLNQDMRQYLITKGLVNDFKAYVYHLYTPTPAPTPTLEHIQEEIKSHIEATKPGDPKDSEVSDVIILPPEVEPQANGSAPPPTVLH